MRKSLIGAALVLLCAVGAMAADDGRFWLRWTGRVPAMTGLAPAAGANAVPPERATIAGPGAPAIPRCAPSPALVEADLAATRYLTVRKTEAFLVWHEGCLVSEHYVTGDAATPRAAGAMAKSLEALAAGRAIREGVIPGLDAPVAATLPEWRGDARAKIRWRDLLSMHAGLQWYRQEASPFSDFQRIIIGSDYAPRALALKSIAAPGALFDYSAWTYDVLGLALARAGGAPYETLASRWLSAPLGLHPMKVYVDRPGGNVHANCCLWSRADDWVRLGALLVTESRQPRLLPPGFVEEMRQGGPDQPNYGLGVWLGSPYRPERRIASPRNPYPTPVKSVIRQSEPFLAGDVMVFEGVGQTKTWVIPSRGLVIVRFGAAPEDWDDARVPNLYLKALGS
ncbi:serine hydrolase domain-containing protein [Novosphingobium sp. BL-52-GroH]|uniref:serine hydrolase domain-containing protein n=1 Tax=Novosphingobium sp. BL-52-GroH TaxID=3349877 RepID=UPI0038512FB6